MSDLYMPTDMQYKRANTIYYHTYSTRLCPLTISCNEHAITSVRFGTPINPEGRNLRTDLLEDAYAEIGEYLCGKRKTFDLPLAPAGTLFQQKVWAALRSIPYGETRSYSQIAQAAGNPNACRAVGMANNKNPIAIIIPCHRVIGKDGSLTGYAGGLGIKKKLLELESRPDCCFLQKS